MTEEHDVIIVGGRCAGASLGMALAREGLRVLVVDRVSFPHDTISTHMIWPPGVAALQRWGVWHLVASAAPAICHKSIACSPLGRLEGPWHAVDGVDYTINLRRVQLDPILLEAARAAGAIIREHFVVRRLLLHDGVVTGIEGNDLSSGRTSRHHAKLVVGADGMNSTVAHAVNASAYATAPSLTVSFYAYFSGVKLDRDADHLYTFPPREFLLIPTDEDLTVCNVVMARELLDDFRRDPPGNFAEALRMVPEISERLDGSRQESGLRGAISLPNYYRKSFGRGWALVGDAAHHRDPIRAQGMHEAFLDAESLAMAVLTAFRGDISWGRAMQDHEDRRNDRTAFAYALCLQAARFQHAEGPKARESFLQLQENPRAIAEYRGLVAGSVHPDDFFEPTHLEELGLHVLAEQMKHGIAGMTIEDDGGNDYLSSKARAAL